MPDVDRLLRWFADGTLVRPTADVPGTVHLARALASLAGAPGIALNDQEQRVAAAIGTADHIVFVLVDGLGMNLVETLRADSFLRAHVVMELQSVHPSSTPAALTSLATGCWPAEHGVISWFTYLADAGVTATILPFIERFSKRPLEEFGITGEQAFRIPSLMPRYAHEPAAFMPRVIAGSTYSRYSIGGVVSLPYDTPALALRAVRRRIERAARPTYSYVYLPFVDQAEHAHGMFADAVYTALLDIERALARLADRLPSGARVVVSADHGQVDVPDEAMHDLDDADPLLELLVVPPTGDQRIHMLHVRSGRRAAFEAIFRERYGERLALLTAQEAEDLRLFGPCELSGTARARIGDYVAIARGADVLRYRPDSPMRGFHGGLLRDEVRIPLIVA
ncbi:MAG: alkaline phosphatase family protein [Chloroflexi bacterium]|nr:alkaline phosphatase family protein [Chloroflexota bacterium]